MGGIVLRGAIYKTSSTNIANIPRTKSHDKILLPCATFCTGSTFLPASIRFCASTATYFSTSTETTAYKKQAQNTKTNRNYKVVKVRDRVGVNPSIPSCIMLLKLVWFPLNDFFNVV